MFLDQLDIHNGSKLIRTISFHKGINLIIDETSSKNKTESGNSVGKTTVLRLIDYCLDGNGENIYTDPEFRGANRKIEKFLKENGILVTLVLVENIDDKQSRKTIIQRNFLQRSNKVQTINGQDFTNAAFSKELKRIIFDTTSDKPTFKQLKSKNIRDEKNKLNHTIRVLSPFDTDAAYETLHLFWFGIDLNLSKDKLVRNLNIEEKLQSRLRKGSNLSQIAQALIIVNKEIEALSIKKDAFEPHDNYEEDLERLNFLKLEISRITGDLSRLMMRQNLILENKKELEKEFSKIDTSQIERLYKKAKLLIPDIQKTFEDTLEFHNQMIINRIGFVSEKLPEIENTIGNLTKTHLGYIEEESVLSEKLHNVVKVENIQTVILKLNEYHESKGHLEEQKRLWEETTENFSKIKSQLEAINSEIGSKDEKIQNRITEFNAYFSEISSKLDGVHSLLSADKPDGFYKFVIGNIEGNPGTGSKKSQMASFDLAYIKFADAKGIPCLHFVLQDQIENVHSNQITNLLMDVVSEINCQYVLPVLRDKLPSSGIDIDKHEILSLSENNKLFRI